MPKMTFDEMIEKALTILAEHNFPYAIYLPIPGTKNVGTFRVSKDYAEVGYFRFEVHASCEGSEYTTYNTTERKAEQELREELKRMAAVKSERDKLRAELEELSDSVDDKEGEFPSDY